MSKVPKPKPEDYIVPTEELWTVRFRLRDFIRDRKEREQAVRWKRALGRGKK